MSKHDFLVVVPVADRPRHIQACLTSLRAALRRFPYAGRIRVLLADDSSEPASIAANHAIAGRFSAAGLEVIHFPPAEQYALVSGLGLFMPRVLGDAPGDRYGHKGQGVMRNIAYLKVAELIKDASAETLIWSIDSDQEFRVNVPEDEGCVVDFFNGIDAIFTRTDALVLTGKVVGDPPVSPAVMTRNFLDDVLAFLARMAERDPAAACDHHATPPAAGDAAYHDMAELFGFKPATSYAYPCPLPGAHTEADCFANFAGRVNSFFYGEHPTRISGYVPGDLFASVQPARTVYAGNYVFRPAALQYFIPFATLRLRMSGPTLGRILKAELGPRFVSANLPMLHKRTVESGGQSEFRPGIETQQAKETRRAAPSVSSPPGGRSPQSGDFGGGLMITCRAAPSVSSPPGGRSPQSGDFGGRLMITRRAAPSVSSPPGGRSPQSGDFGVGLVIDMSGEFERQFYGDLMLFSVERLAAECRALSRPASADFGATLDTLREEMLNRYNARQQAILHRLDDLDAHLADPARWWNRSPEQAAGFRQFAANVRHNFGAASSGHARINDAANWTQWRGRLLDALAHYAEDRAAWSQLI